VSTLWRRVQRFNRHIKFAQCNIPENRRENRKTFMCEYCNKMCPSQGHLNFHKKIHGEKNILCDQCDYKTYTKHNLQLHIVRVHEKGELYKTCQICSKRCTSLDWHMKTYHVT